MTEEEDRLYQMVMDRNKEIYQLKCKLCALDGKIGYRLYAKGSDPNSLDTIYTSDLCHIRNDWTKFKDPVLEYRVIGDWCTSHKKPQNKITVEEVMGIEWINGEEKTKE